MENLVSDEDFVMILLTLLPESWDNYTGAYLGSSSNKPTITSHELIAVLFEEDRRSLEKGTEWRFGGDSPSRKGKGQRGAWT